MSYERHPLSAAWPDMAREDFDALVASIERHGLREPITLMDGKVLDGWHRYQACESLGIEGATVVFDGTAEEAENLVNDRHTRRSITPVQRAAAALKMYEWRTGSGSHKKEIQNRNVTVLDVQQIADKAGVSKSTVEKVKAATKADPNALDKIRDGKETAGSILKKAKPEPAPQKPVEKPEAPANDLQAKHDDMKDRYDDLVLSAKELADQVQTLDAIKAGETEVAKEMNRLRAQVRSLEEVRDRLMTTNAEQVRQIKGQQKTIAKLEAQIAEQKAVAEADF